MATITVDGIPFYILPETAAWSYSMKIQSFDTYDGRVVQLLACNVDSLSVEGYIPPRRIVSSDPGAYGSGALITDQWSGMEEFEWNVKRIMQSHEQGGRALRGESYPAHFSFPEVGWDGEVYLVGYNDVRYDPDSPAVRYTLKFEIDSGFGDIQQAASDQGLKNIPDGVGWVRSVYNTPDLNSESWEKFKTAIENIVDDAGTHDASSPADFYEYLRKSFEGDEEDGEKERDGDSDDKFTSKVAKATAKTVTNLLSAIGIVGSGGNRVG